MCNKIRIKEDEKKRQAELEEQENMAGEDDDEGAAETEADK